MAGVISSSSHPILLRILRPPSAPPSPSPSPSSSLLSFFLFKPLTTICPRTLQLRSFSFSSSSSLPSRPLICPSSTQLPLHPLPISLSTSQLTLGPNIEDQCDDDEEEEIETGNEESELEGEEEAHDQLSERVSNSSPSTGAKESSAKLPSLTVKEKKELASYAHSLGKKLKSQQVGKSGVTDSVATALVETLEANELLKIKIHNNCPGELEDAVKKLEELTGSVVVGQIGRTVILYRPSITKLKAEEKKKQALKVFARRKLAFKSSFENKGLLPRLSGRGLRGSSRSLRSP